MVMRDNTVEAQRDLTTALSATAMRPVKHHAMNHTVKETNEMENPMNLSEPGGPGSFRAGDTNL